jgi:ABC-type branched-subunit amino acid transport system permease subunit
MKVVIAVLAVVLACMAGYLFGITQKGVVMDDSTNRLVSLAQIGLWVVLVGAGWMIRGELKKSGRRHTKNQW